MTLFKVCPSGRKANCQLTEQEFQLLSTAFINPDGKVSVVVMNKSDKNGSYYLWLDGNAAEVSSLPHSIQTLVF